MKTNFGLFLESSYGNTRKFLSFNPLIDTFNHFRIQKIKYSRTLSMTSNDLGGFSCRRKLMTVVVSIFKGNVLKSKMIKIMAENAFSLFNNELLSALSDTI